MSAGPPSLPESTPPGPRELRRVLGTWDAAALIVGVMIGSGIFATPPLVAGHLPALVPMLGIWILGGVLALCGALCYAELTAMFPRTGGAYVFLREGYGRFPAFVFGWSDLFVTYPASIAAVALVFVAYLARVVPIPEPARPAAAAALCLGLAALNVFGVRLGATALRAMTAAKVAALAVIVVAAAVLHRGSPGHMAPLWGAPPGGWAAAPIALSLVAVIWTYEGWADGPTLAGETRDPDRDVARALLIGTLGITVIYVLVNLAYLYVLGVDGVRASDAVAADVAARLFGSGGTAFVTAMVLVSTLGSVMAMIIAASRVVFAVARDRLFVERVGRVHPRFGTPAAALGTVGAVSAVYALLGSFETIIGIFVFVAQIWFVLIIASVIGHRIRRPGHPRPFRIPLYPWPAVLYLLVAGTLVVELLRQDPRNAAVGLGVLAAAVPVYGAWRLVARGSGRRS